MRAFLLCAAVRGSTSPGGRGRLSAAGTSRLSATTSWALGLPGTHNPWGLGFGSLERGFWLGFVFHIGFESGFAGFLDFQDGISVDIRD
jgi:hypothetical protein